jgi:hypothetical protein
MQFTIQKRDNLNWSFCSVEQAVGVPICIHCSILNREKYVALAIHIIYGRCVINNTKFYSYIDIMLASEYETHISQFHCVQADDRKILHGHKKMATDLIA